MNLYSIGNKVEGVTIDRLENGNICTQVWVNGRYVSIKQITMTKEGARGSDGDEMAKRLMAILEGALNEVANIEREDIED